MSGWDGGLDRVILQLEHAEQHMLPAIGAAVLDSIQNGSQVTGSPGQPVGQYGPGYNEGEVGGTLKLSYGLTFPTPTTAEISSKSEYAIPNETGVSPKGGPYVQRSTVGGRFSVASTRANIQRLVDHVVNEGMRPEGFTSTNAGALGNA
jgi:hypothetical protein